MALINLEFPEETTNSNDEPLFYTKHQLLNNNAVAEAKNVQIMHRTLADLLNEQGNELRPTSAATHRRVPTPKTGYLPTTASPHRPLSPLSINSDGNSTISTVNPYLPNKVMVVSSPTPSFIPKYIKENTIEIRDESSKRKREAFNNRDNTQVALENVLSAVDEESDENIETMNDETFRNWEFFHSLREVSPNVPYKYTAQEHIQMWFKNTWTRIKPKLKQVVCIKFKSKVDTIPSRGRLT